MKLKDWDEGERNKKKRKDKVTDGTLRFGRDPEEDGEAGRDEADLEWDEAGVSAEREGEEPTGEWDEAAIGLTKQKFRKFSLNREDEDRETDAEGKEQSSDLQAKSAGATVRNTVTDKGRRPGEEEAAAREEDDWDELPPLKPWAKVLIFLGLAALAAVICGILWHFVHPDRPADGNTDLLAQATQAPDGEEGRQPDLDLPEASGGQSGPDLMLDSTPHPEGEPGAESDKQTGAGTGAGTGGGGETESAGQPGTEADAEQDRESGAAPVENPEQSGAQTTAEPEEEIQEPVAGNKDMVFGEVQESVTPKDVVNLRSVPTTADAENIVTQARNGETLTRTGVNDSTGWSRIDYNGQTLYAVTQYLTADLSYKPPVKPSDPNRVSTISGRLIIFRNCDDWITPKEYVNLRTEPSTTEGEATVSCQLNSGEKAHRTGYSTDSGWSRVEYNGQVLYVVTSLIYEVPAE